MGEGKWIDFRDIKDQVTMEMVLRHYGVFENLRKSGKNMVGACPIHKGTNKRQFSVNLERNIYNCFGNCQSGGNVLDFVSKMEGLSLFKAAKMLTDIFGSTKLTEGTKEPKKIRIKRQNHEKRKPPSTEEGVNKPLNFILKSLKFNHSFFHERKINPDTIEHFGLGYCTKGIFKGRIAIPIHNENGELVAYCGRAVDEDQIEKGGKYKLPSNFTKSATVYNLSRIEKEETLIVVESFFSVFRFWQAGIKNVVSIMGSSLSDSQLELICSYLGLKGRLILAFDCDESGEKCTKDALLKFSPKLFVKVLEFSHCASKPHQLTTHQIKELQLN
ncbi:CHC2 zinc finger domain-containing protein [uncultured Desulfosarcina sp.]|uniref:CHC2 zinc finger domain-containing protein n=1 Tax=uncultured Desulfosarcina sp. TaxID=218289 RepID=UPI0029C90FF6|nr:CHC2 zinc finger domain-containing protein [uncultured Desulfosarcina sp.]